MAARPEDRQSSGTGSDKIGGRKVGMVFIIFLVNQKLSSSPATLGVVNSSMCGM